MKTIIALFAFLLTFTAYAQENNSIFYGTSNFGFAPAKGKLLVVSKPFFEDEPHELDTELKAILTAKGFKYAFTIGEIRDFGKKANETVTVNTSGTCYDYDMDLINIDLKQCTYQIEITKLGKVVFSRVVNLNDIKNKQTVLEKIMKAAHSIPDFKDL